MRARPRIAIAVVIAALVLAAACADKRQRRSDDDDEPKERSSGDATGSLPRGAWPVIEIVGSAIQLDGRRIATLPADGGKLSKVDELFVELKGRRETWKQSHPDKPFPGVCGIRVDPGVPMSAFKSVFQTAAYAGYPYLSVQTAGDAGSIVNLTAQIPGPPEELTGKEPAPPEKLMMLTVSPQKVILLWKQGSVVVSSTDVEPDPDKVERVVCDEWRMHSAHHATSDGVLDVAIVQAQDLDTFRSLAPYLDAVRACKRVLDGQRESISVFDITFSIR